MPRLVNPYTIRYDEIKEGDVMVYIVKAMVVRPGIYRLYKCHYDGSTIPQGNRILHDEDVCQELFPTLYSVAHYDRDWTDAIDTLEQ